ncbi:AAA family ATPase [Flavobacterium sandaracinum]|uniref:Endonuclease GajA/Old nuclease/RecF-like AAA domain-containing protein n=1 Tax=Flavobacterium sandaracinum TaxID=2541733 RepID=A0A4R5DC45_9FLAO|nr:AAA family ATPase [Flavobacterium sandaracinum]TDE07833.1 hypothetical protein E0F91_01765 [Flavobacterium sandaracinum]
MKLEKIKLKNFRCYNTETVFIVDDLTCIIGKNDIGKSTIIEALDAFFNDNIDAGDLSSNGDSNVIEVTCFFSGIPDKIVLDATVPTSPKEEGLLNENDELEIVRRYSVGATVSKSIFINCFYPVDLRIDNLLSLKKDTLILKAEEELGIDLTGVPKNQNPALRRAIREFIGGDRALKEIKVDGSLSSESNLKTIWGKLKVMLPIFTLFKVDKPLEDKDKDVQDPMKSAVDETLALPEIRVLLEQIEEKVREKSSEVADGIIAKLKDIDSSLAEKLKTDFKKSPSWKSVFDLTLMNENNIPLNKRGSGVRRLVLLSFFQAQAEKRKSDINAPSIIYAIEEPETSQHPNHQLLLIKSLIELSEQNNTQVMFTSHNANLVREIPIQSLRYISQVPDALLVEYGLDYVTGEKNEATIQKIIQTLGILPNPADKVKIIIFVEGNHDVNGLKRYSLILNAQDNNILDLNSDDIAWVIVGGSSLKHYIENNYLEGLGKPQVHIYDSDVPAYIGYVAKINAEGNPNKIAFNTTKQELESYLHHNAINEAYIANGNICTLTEITDTDDVPFKVAENLYTNSGNDWAVLEELKKKEKSSQKKQLLNQLAVEKMTVDRIVERGGYDEMKHWFSEIKRLKN